MSSSQFINGSLLVNGNINPFNSESNLGSLQNPWKSMYVSTGTVFFVGSSGALEINNNNLISSFGGFAAPYYQVGATNPGSGILLYEQQNKLFFQNQLGASGPISVFNVASNSINN